MAGATSEVDSVTKSFGISTHSDDSTAESVRNPDVVGVAGKPMQPPSLGLETGLGKATMGSDWYDALQKKNCKVLMELLQADPCLIVQTGAEGYTVIHAAAERGCSQLLNQVCGLFNNSKKFVDVQSGVKIDWYTLLYAEHGDFKAKATDYAWFVWGQYGDNQLFTQELEISGEHNDVTDEFNHLTDELRRIMRAERAVDLFKDLEDGYRRDEKYNFVLEREELRFHYACAGNYDGKGYMYLKNIIRGCLDHSQSVELLTHLFQLRNAQGLTPLHLALKKFSFQLTNLLEQIPNEHAYMHCFNATDAKGWTTLHSVVVRGNYYALEALLKYEQVDVNIRISDTGDSNISCATALHLAILHNDVKSVELLLRCSRTDVNAICRRNIVCGYESLKLRGPDYERIWSPLQLAAVMGLSNVVRMILNEKLPKIFDDGKVYNDNILTRSLHKKFLRTSALLFASASGNPDTLRLFLDNLDFNPLVKFEEATALHYATNAMEPFGYSQFFPHPIRLSDGEENRYLDIRDFDTLDKNFKFESMSSVMDKKTTLTSYLGNQACITMLLQAGVDIWEKDVDKRFPEPGPQAPEEAHLWWHERIAKETLEAKKSLTDAANAISVVAALVATASFVGPLQPPLGYGQVDPSPDLHVIQNTVISVQVFTVSNSLSFYLAVASILFAVVPSLPMPQEGIYAEWQRTRRTVAMAIFFLLLSVLGVLTSFAAASNSVVSEEYSWKHVGLTFYPTLVGGLICIAGIVLFFLRLLRLVFNRNERIRYLYSTFVKF